MTLKPEEAAIFDDVSWDEPKADPLPPPPKKEPIVYPDCVDCGVSLNPENSSKLRGGKFKHIGCPKGLATEPAKTVASSETKQPATGSATITPPVAASVITTPVPAKPKQVATLTGAVISTVFQIELGPETLAVLKALLAK